ncbi:type VI secretion system baseplate subunit TssK [Rhodobacteraceae bacterium]|nr:type VI secretion system baseplate subunit TssK [Paracoccaceae bacterium]
MASRGKVVWSEGMFLRTQHFQQQDARLESLVSEAFSALPYPWFGFRKLTLDENALAAGLFGVLEAAGHLPDGTAFSISSESMALVSAKVAAGNDNGVVSLGLPAETDGTPTVDPVHSSESSARFKGALVTVRDAVRGGADAEEIELASLQPRLFLPEDDASGYVTLPLARLTGLDASGAVTVDEGFLSPAQMTSAVPWYGRFAQEVVTGLDRIADAHSAVVLAGTGASVENLLILEMVNGARPRMAHFLSQDQFHPSEFFMELAGLAGRMATFGSSSRRMAELPEYDHEDPQPAFAALTDTLRSLMLSLRHVEEKAKALKVSRHAENVWTVRIDNPELLRNSRIMVRVGGELSDALLRKLFVDQVTVGAADEFDKLWTARLTGIPLKALNSQPREIPYDGDRLCLELDRSSEHWAALAEAPGFVIGVSGKLDREPEIDCYAISR